MKFTVFVLVAATLVGLAATERLLLEFYIESLCRYSKAFVLTQLRVVYPKAKADCDFKYITHGKSSSFINSTGGTEFTCQHGLIECENNRRQTCALDLISADPDPQKVQDRSFTYIVCTMSDIITKPYSVCATLAGLKSADVEACANGPKGIELQLIMEEKSKPIIDETQRVPVAVLNGKFVEQEYAHAIADLYGFITEKLAELNP